MTERQRHNHSEDESGANAAEYPTVQDMYRHAYKATHSEDEQWAVVDDSQQAALQYLRVNSVSRPSEFRAEEFEKTFDFERPLATIEAAVYQQECERVATLSKAERRILLDRLVETKLRGREGRAADSLGTNVRTFLIDSETMEWACSGFPEHDQARCVLHDMQRDRIAVQYGNQYEAATEAQKAARGRWIQGFMYLDVEGYTSPILKLDATPIDSDSKGEPIWLDLTKGTGVGAFIHRMRFCIPIRRDGTLIE